MYEKALSRFLKGHLSKGNIGSVRLSQNSQNVTLNQVLNLIQDLTISGSHKPLILLDAEPSSA